MHVFGADSCNLIFYILLSALYYFIAIDTQSESDLSLCESENVIGVPFLNVLNIYYFHMGQ